MERNREEQYRRRRQLMKTITAITSIAGYIVVGVLVGMYLDDRFFDNNGIAIIVGFIIGVIAIIINIVKLVILSRDN